MQSEIGDPGRMLGNGIPHGVDGTSTPGPGIGTAQGHPPVEGTQQYCLRWNSYPATIATQLAALKAAEDFVDVTLACEGQQLQAHKLVLSACSPYFMQLFKSTPCQHPVVFLRDVRFCQLRALLEFMYAGEVNVSQTDLPALLRTAEALQVRGLADTTTNNNFPTQIPLQKPVYTTQQQQYVPNTNPGIAQIPAAIPVTAHMPSPPQQQHQHVDVMDPDTSESIPADLIVLPENDRLPVPEVAETRSREESNENESSKENQMDASSSDSNDSQEDYIPGCQYDEKLNLNSQQDDLPPLTNNPFANLNTPGSDGEGILPGVGSETWNMGLGSISLGGSQSEAEISDEDNDEDDGEIKEDFLMPPISSEMSAYHNQEPGENKGSSPNGENVIVSSIGPSMNSSFPFPSTNSDKSKDLTSFSSNSNPPNNVPPRNRFSRALWPPGVPYHGPQQCPYCTRVLSNVGNWRKHVYTMHFSREKNFKCCHCNSSFRTSEYLQKHYVRVHSYAPKMSRKKGPGSSSGGSGLSSTTLNQTLPNSTMALTNSSLNP